jgi:hypothetical protein
MAHSHDVDRFNRWATSYDRHWMQRIIFGPIQRTVLQLAAEQVGRPGAILDVGCGKGKLLRSAETKFPGASHPHPPPVPEFVPSALCDGKQRSCRALRTSNGVDSSSL